MYLNNGTYIHKNCLYVVILLSYEHKVQQLQLVPDANNDYRQLFI